MPIITQDTPLFRHARLAVIACLAVSLLTVAPRVSHTGPIPAPPADSGSAADRQALLDLVAGLGRSEAQPAPAPDGHALRRKVAPFAVRLAVDPRAAHPLDGPVAVHPSHLGSPGQPLRRFALVEPAPRPEPTAVANLVPTAPRTESGKAVPVKIATPPAQPAPAPRLSHRALPGPGRSVLVAGDSLSIYLAEALRPLLAGRPGTNFAARGKVSSGLARPDFFNWEREMLQLATANRPDTVLVMIATNDNQTLTRPDGSKVAFGRPGWEAEYARRVRRLVELARTGNPEARVYWIGAPVMANPRLNADVAAINAVLRRQVAALPGCRYVDVWPTLADTTGHYTPSLPGPGGLRTTRTPDGVHLTSYGARLLADACLASLSPTVADLGRP
jgi:uncharacterized protein